MLELLVDVVALVDTDGAESGPVGAVQATTVNHFDVGCSFTESFDFLFINLSLPIQLPLDFANLCDNIEKVFSSLHFVDVL